MDSHPSTGEVAGYSHGHQPSVLASHATRTASNSCAYFLDRIAPRQSILDIGCGPGSITLDLARLVGPTGRVVGVDYSSDAIDAARSEADRRQDDTTEFFAADLLTLDVEPGSFDIVHAHQVLQHVPDPVAALQAMRRYCSPDGLIVVRDADYGAMAWYPSVSGLDLWRDTYCAGSRATGGEPDAGRRLHAWARQADLQVDWTGSSTWTYATPQATQWWSQSQAERVRHSNFAARAADQGLTPTQIEQVALAWEQWGASPDAWFMVPHGELIARPGGC